MLTALLIFLLAVVALLAIPVELQFRVEWPDDTRNEIVLVWALGLLRARIPMTGPAMAATADERVSNQKRRDNGESTNVMVAFRQRPFRQRLYRFVRDLWRSVSQKNVRIRARVGLDDPADTGQLWAIVGPIAGFLGTAKTISVAIEPDFANPTVEFEGSGSLLVVPLQIVAILLGMLVSPAVWRGLRAMGAS